MTLQRTRKEEGSSSAQMASTFTNDEKRFVLTELIKSSKVDVQVLADFFKANCKEYSWFSVQLPTGRNAYECIQVTEEMTQVPIPDWSLKPPPRTFPPTTSTSSPATALAPPLLVAQHQNTENHAGASPSISTGPSGPTQATPNRSSTPQHVHIQPRVSLVNGIPRHSASPPPTKRRRGRPPRKQNLRYVSGPESKSLPPLAPQPQPFSGLNQAPVSCAQSEGGKPSTPSPVYSTAGPSDALEERSRKRARLSSDEALQEIKVERYEGSPLTAARVSPLAQSEPSDPDAIRTLTEDAGRGAYLCEDALWGITQL
ncbi:uncharacterized protein DNG_01432 [Cephalotrichum gorgonifer]|uniref:Uncharacterized protein n=1 Tax=Cephalotrichum gorgonifer TaxID=2041049 RepID=A0AAE8SS78_9PEZI|nr:uncharacterized protein DNG_01432 [Cephalotrichum gorgonifer]